MRILVVDDDHIVLKSLELILKSEGIEEVEVSDTGDLAYEKYIKKPFDIVLQDIRMKEENGLDTAKKILDFDKKAKIILLTTFKDEEYINKAISIGVKGYLLKENIDSLKQSIEAVLAGNMVLDSEVISEIRIKDKKVLSKEELGINARDMEIIKLVSEGLNNKEIAQELFLSQGTVRNYISIILDKLNLRDRTQLVVYYYKNLI